MPRPATVRRLILAAALAACASAAEAASEGGAARIERVGERLFLVRDRPGTPTHFQMIVAAGCNDEADGQCRGMAHYLEHLVLVGRNPEHRDAAVRMFAEGYANGWTNDRATAFVHRVPARPEGARADLERLFGFYAARLRDFSIAPEDAERERRVVRQEHDVRVGSQPFRRFARNVDRALLPDHPAGQWTIGTKEDIDAFTLEAARAFHARWYRPDNVWFVVRGDVEPALLKEIAERALADIPSPPQPPRPPPRRPDFSPGRTDLRASDPEVRRPAVYYRKLVAIPESDPEAHRAARMILTDYLASRLPGALFSELVEKRRLAASQPSMALRRVARGVYVLSIGADPAPDAAPESLLDGIVAYVDGLGGRIDAATVERLKTRFARGRELGDDDPARVHGRLVGWLANRRAPETLAQWPAKVAAVTPDEVAAIGRGLAGPGRIVTGILTPPAEAPK